MLNMKGLDQPARHKLAEAYYAWEHAKWTFKATLIVDIVVVKHLVVPHLLVAGPLATESKMLLRPDHWMRRFLRPLTFRSITINDAAINTLLAEYGSVQRQTSLYEIGSLRIAIRRAADAYRFLSFPDWVETKKLAAAETDALPLVEDGRRLWNIYETFVTKLVDTFVPSDASDWAPEDKGAIDRFFKAINAKYHDPDGVMGRRRATLLDTGKKDWRFYRDYNLGDHPKGYFGIPELTTAAAAAAAGAGGAGAGGSGGDKAHHRGNKQNITRVLTHALFTVSAWHEVLGNANEYTDFRGADTRIYSFAQMKSNGRQVRETCDGEHPQDPDLVLPEGHWVQDLHSVVGTSVVAAAIGTMKMPMILGTNVVSNWLQCPCRRPTSNRVPYKMSAAKNRRCVTYTVDGTCAAYEKLHGGDPPIEDTAEMGWDCEDHGEDGGSGKSVAGTWGAGFKCDAADRGSSPDRRRWQARQRMKSNSADDRIMSAFEGSGGDENDASGSCSAENRAKDQRIKEAYRDLKVALKKMADDVDERNRKDPAGAFNAFNPRQLEWSVSV